LRDADAEHYVARPAPLSLGSYQALPLPGRVELGDAELELHPAEGHARDGTAFLAELAGVLVCGDYLSDVEIPLIAAAGSPGDYRATLERLRPLVARVDTVVPGHGAPHDAATALRILEEDLAYLDALESGEERVTLPPGRDTARQRAIHADNVAKHGPRRA
jgi:glyoxylase-like metal-dependent hydrolase (beta-lactamase superfamily II)